MKTIEIDEDVFTELESRATGFNVTPNTVLRKILQLSAEASPAATPLLQPQDAGSADKGPTNLLEFIRTERFLRHTQAVDRYLLILAWLRGAHDHQFIDAALGFQRGTRKYFGESESDILENGENVTARQIPNSNLWALTTLNKTKRQVLEDLLRVLGYSPAETNTVTAQVPDSGIRRNHGLNLYVANP